MLDWNLQELPVELWEVCSALVHFVLLYQNIADWIINKEQKFISQNSRAWEVQGQGPGTGWGCCLLPRQHLTLEETGQKSKND